MRNIFDAAIAAETFRGKDLLKKLMTVLDKQPELYAAYQSLVATWPEKSTAADTFLGIVRWSFLIELVKMPKVETTKFEVRWADSLGKDPRSATYEECVEMCVVLASDVAKSAKVPERRTLLEAFDHHSLVPYELPVDYRKRERSGPIHIASNVEWLWGDIPRKTVLLRDYLLSPAVGSHRKMFEKVYKKKVNVKTYLTDRAQTGDHKTNREKRWETHPASVHYSLRRDCLEIEYQLMRQLCHFTGFPSEIKEQLKETKLIDVSTEPFRCPITLEPLSFEEFKAEIDKPVSGKSSFHVGHLNPLKAANDDPCLGHTAKNISWVSENGNRIQGSLSLDETRLMIKRIVANYDKFNVK